MGSYYISEIAASGRDVRTSSIQFHQGVNIVHGPSNTGKSMIVKIIDYLFGGDSCPANPNRTGYSDFRMTLKDDCGHEASITRSVECDDDGNERAVSKIRVESNCDVMPSGIYNAKSSGKKSEKGRLQKPAPQIDRHRKKCEDRQHPSRKKRLLVLAGLFPSVLPKRGSYI